MLKLNICIWKPAILPSPRKHTHITPLQQCWDCSEGSIEKLFLCTVWHVTSASHLTHCRVISPSLSWDELCPEDKLQRWISIIVSLLHSCCERGGPALKAGKSSHICLDKWAAVFQLVCLVTWLRLHVSETKKMQFYRLQSTPAVFFFFLLQQELLEKVMSVLMFFFFFSPHYYENFSQREFILTDITSSGPCWLNAPRGSVFDKTGFWLSTNFVIKPSTSGQ